MINLSADSWRERGEWWRKTLARRAEPTWWLADAETEAEQQAHDLWWEDGLGKFHEAVNYRMDIKDVPREWMTHDTEACLKCVVYRKRLAERRRKRGRR